MAMRKLDPQARRPLEAGPELGLLEMVESEWRKVPSTSGLGPSLLIGQQRNIVLAEQANFGLAGHQLGFKVPLGGEGRRAGAEEGGQLLLACSKQEINRDSIKRTKCLANGFTSSAKFDLISQNRQWFAVLHSAETAKGGMSGGGNSRGALAYSKHRQKQAEREQKTHQSGKPMSSDFWDLSVLLDARRTIEQNRSRFIKNGAQILKGITREHLR